MSNVVEFPTARTVEQVLDNAKDFPMTHVVVIGFNEHTREPFFDSTTTSLAQIMLMLERAKFQMLSNDFTSVDDDNEPSPGLTG